MAIDLRRAPLSPFNENARCPKCRHDVVKATYTTGGSYGTLSCSYSCSYRSSLREHLDRRCERCNYQWAEAVVDAPTDPTP